MAETGDIIRRIIYPLVLPVIFVSVWAHAWAMRSEDGPVPMAPPVSHAVTRLPPFPGSAVRPPGYGFSHDDDTVASADGNADDE